MSEMKYLRAVLDGAPFAVPSPAIDKIVSDPAVMTVPGAPEGICGIGYDEGEVFAIRSVKPGKNTPARLAVLLIGQTEREAYAADCVEAMETLGGDEQAHALPVGDRGVLLLGGKERND